MKTEDEIASLLVQGLSPADLVDRGYKKSTVYKVYAKRQRDPRATPKGSWSFENVKLSKERYMPGEVATIWSQLRNNTPYDFYVGWVGIQPEWMIGRWYPQEVRNLLKPNASMLVTLTVPIPTDLPLGEHVYTFGVEGQFMGQGGDRYGSLHQTEWSEPEILGVKYPAKGLKIFFSHSTENMPLVRQIETILDNYGYHVIIAEDVPEPGVILREKFQQKIRESNLVLTLMTHEGSRSQWVIEEANYARSIGKPLLPLKERNVGLESDIEWVEFSRDESAEQIGRKTLEAVANMQKRFEQASLWAAVALLLVPLIVLSLGSSKK